ncbi:hypothetical protein [Domibacillus mangrovi]|uniref:RiboL-PSP-HEPN domain-containing protein n=1 Tax=Domibacillus mangrovi TaxID=1714354 RepID=A0A1Q5P469_9BACI|nr:hypothetical protein [Domibacillus mangrovi]OKL37008.1 hypothetical protein BLL40_05295 [Domibacillus mangrovi]
MSELSFMDNVESKGYGTKSEMYLVYLDIMGRFMDYEMAYKYVEGSAKVEIESATEPGLHLLLEPIILPSIANAMFLAIYGDFEAFLNRICVVHRSNNSYTLGYRDLYGNGIERAVTYLNKVVGLKDIKKSIEWNDLRDWNKIRNILVHNNGVTRDEKDAEAMRKLKIKADNEYNRVSMSIEDLDRFHNLIVQFLMKCV